MVRSFRYAATLTAHQVGSSLIRACLALGDARETAQRQVAAEEKKRASKVRVARGLHAASWVMQRGLPAYKPMRAVCDQMHAGWNGN